MEISAQVHEIISVLSAFTGHRLKDPGMLSRFLQYAQDGARTAELGELAFKAKYLTRLHGAIVRQTAESELYEKLEEEFSRSIHEFHGLVAAYVEGAPQEFRVMVEAHHLAVSQEALRRLMDLAADFTHLKNWELEMTQPSPDAPSAPED